MIYYVLGGVAAIVVLLVIFIATRPSKFRIERSITIAAPPQIVFMQVNDFHRWTAWSPWEKLDLDMKRTHEGAASGAGAIYSWAGNKKVGEGRMTIEKSEPPSLIAIKLEFIKPFAATNTTTFTFTPVPEGTKVLWAMEGNHNFMSKAFCLVMSMDKMVGGDFERGLEALKGVSQSAASAA